ncbi:hypothetical protein D3C76_1479820 [compost metagenome]
MPWVTARVLLPSIENTPVAVALSPRKKSPARSKRELLVRLTLSQPMYRDGVAEVVLAKVN